MFEVYQASILELKYSLLLYVFFFFKLSNELPRFVLPNLLFVETTVVKVLI